MLGGQRFLFNLSIRLNQSFPITLSSHFRSYTTSNRLKKRLKSPRSSFPELPDHFSETKEKQSLETEKKRIFISNLSLETDWKDLKDHFRVIGPVAYASISKDLVTKVSKGCGLVQFETAMDMKRAIQELNGSTLLGNIINVREDIQDTNGKKTSQSLKIKTNSSEPLTPRQDQDKSTKSSHKNDTKKFTSSKSLVEDEEEPVRKSSKIKISESKRHLHRIYVSGLPLTYKWSDVKDFFKTIGRVNYCDIYTHIGTGKSKGTAVVEFERQHDVNKAIERLNGAIIEPEGMLIRVEPFQEDSPVSSPSKLPSSAPPSSSPTSSRSSNTFSSLSSISTSIPPLVPVLRPTSIILPESMQSSLAVLSDPRVFFNHMPRHYDWKILKDTFSVIGTVVHVDVFTDPHTGKSRGCGIIKFKTIQEAKKAIETLHLCEIDGKKIDVIEYKEDREERHDRLWRMNQVLKIPVPKIDNDEYESKELRRERIEESRKVIQLK